MTPYRCICLDSNLYIAKLKIIIIALIPMQQYPSADWLQTLLNNYIQHARTCSDAKQAETAARDMTTASRDPNFIPSAFALLKRSMRNRDATILLTALIKNVFRYDFQDVSWSEINNYYSDLIFIAKQISYEVKPILKNISMTLAYLYIHYSSIQTISIFHFLRPLQPFNLESPAQSPLFLYYFHTLQYIASQISNSKLVVAEQQRQTAKQQAIEQQINVIRVIHNSVAFLNNAPELAVQSLLQSLVSWVNLNSSPHILNSLRDHQGLALCLKEIEKQNGYDGATDCLASIISSIGYSPQCMPLIEFIGYNIPRIVGAAEARLSSHQFNEAENIIQTIVDYSVKTAGTFAKQPNKDIFYFLQRLVSYTGCLDLQIPKAFSRFWQSYLEELSRVRNTYEVEQMVNSLIWNLFNALVTTIIYTQPTLLEMSNHVSQSESIDDSNHQNLPARRRKASLYVFQSIAKVITTPKFFSMVCDSIKALPHNSPNFWGTFEALIYSLITPAKKLIFVNDDVNFLLNTYAQISQTPSLNCPKAVLKTFIQLFTSIMVSKCRDQCFISNVFYYITLALSEPSLTRQSDRAFLKACESQGYLFSKQPQQLSNTLKLYPERDFVVRGIFTIFLHSQEAIASCLQDNLHFLRQQTMRHPHGSTKRRRVMGSLIAACRLLKQNNFYVNQLQITKRFIRQSMPFLKESLTTIAAYDQDEDAQIQRTVKLIKHLMRSVTLRFYDFLPEMLECVMNSFRKHPICSYVYLVQVVITVFSKEEEYETYLLSVYRLFCEICSHHLSDSDKVEKYSFLLDDFIGMNKRLFVYNSSLLLKSGELPRLIEQIIDYMQSDTPRVVKAAYSFFQTTFMAYWSSDLIQEFNIKNKEDHHIEVIAGSNAHEQLKANLQDKIHYIIAKMLDHLARAPAEIIRDCIIDAVTAELAAFPEWNIIIWPQLINPLPNSILVNKQKQYFMELVESTLNPKLNIMKTSERLRSMLNLMLKRMITASKRKDYNIEN